ncbi:MAG: DUF2613 family protein [Jatrophihabitantaceae bacterium]
MPSLLTAVFCLLLVGATVIGIVTTNDQGQRPSVGSFQSDSGLVLYGGR